MKNEVIPGFLIMLATVFALVICNMGFSGQYNDILGQYIAFSIGSMTIKKQLLPLINEGLMALFFLVVSIEIRMEFLFGTLKDRSFVLLPFIAAVGGMVVPAAIYLGLNWGTDMVVGWAIPTATDIAFSLACLMLLGSRVSKQVRVFLLSLAIFDDLGAIIIIALYYSQNLSMLMLMGGFFAFFTMLLMSYFRFTRISGYLFVGFLLWLFLLKSGVHATLAGCFVALSLPMWDDGERVHQLYKRMLPLVEYLILPIFAFANTGIVLSGTIDLLHPVSVGIILGLVLGKPLGIMLFTYVANKLSLVTLNQDIGYREVLGVSMLCGIGFTMSLFVGMLAFDEQIVAMLNTVKISVLIASLTSALLGLSFMRLYCKERS